MPDEPTSPLLSDTNNQQQRSGRPPSQESNASTRSRRSQLFKDPKEETPLLSQEANRHDYGNAPLHDEANSAAASSLRLCYAGRSRRICKAGYSFEPTDLSIDGFTPEGVRARIQSDFTLDGSRVQKESVRDLSHIGTWIVKAVESKCLKVKVYSPEYDDLLIGTANVPPIMVNVRDGHTTHIDFLSDLVAGDLDGIRRMAIDWIKSKIGHVRLREVAEVPLKSRIFKLGTQNPVKDVKFSGKEIPAMPKYNISKLNFHEVKIPGAGKGMEADVLLTIRNDHPLTFTVPPLGFDILVPGCSPEQPYIMLADATTDEILVDAKEDVHVEVDGFIKFP